MTGNRIRVTIEFGDGQATAVFDSADQKVTIDEAVYPADLEIIHRILKVVRKTTPGRYDQGPKLPRGEPRTRLSRSGIIPDRD